MFDDQIPLLTRILEAGDASKIGLYKPEVTQESEPLPQVAETPLITTDISDVDLIRLIDEAVDSILPTIKHQLYQELSAHLTKND